MLMLRIFLIITMTKNKSPYKNPLLKNKTALFLIASALIFAACSTRPSYVLSDKEMENILYDLYLADAVKEDNHLVFSSDSARRQDLTDEVFRKYKTTEQQFDTSLLWYAGNLERYEKIIDRVVLRYNTSAEDIRKEIAAAGAALDSNRNSLIDTAWFALKTPGLFQNRYTFNLKDPAQLREQNFSINMDVLGVSSTIKPELFVHIFTPDSTFKYHENIRMDGRFSKSFSMPPNTYATRIYGYIELPDSIQAFVLFRNFSLAADTVKLSENIKQLPIVK
jgi:hypothetical protein